MYTALYRKWRPTRFEDIYGQDQVTVTISNELREGKISHAYLFCGTRGTGKTTSAKLLAKAVNCLNPSGINPCDACESCVSINEGNSIDVFEIDAASNRGIDDIRNLREGIRFTPTIGKYKVYIIDEVHMLTTEAFNALLKTLEEPPDYVIFVLATTEAHKLPATVLSRCQRFDFKRIASEKIIERLSYICEQENLTCTQDAFRIITSNADGSMRDALSIMDQCSVYGKQEITAQIVLEVLGMSGGEALIKIGDAILQENTPVAINLVGEISASGKDINQLIRDMVHHFRNLLMTKVVEHPEDVIDQGVEHVNILKNHAEHYTRDNIIRCINIISTLENEAKFAANPRILLEIAVVKMCKVSHDLSHDGLMARLAKLESAAANGTIINTSAKVNSNNDDYSSSSSTVSSSRGSNSTLAAAPSKIEVGKSNEIDSKDTSATNTELSEGDMLRKWPGFVKSLIAERKMAIATMLRIGKPLKVDGNVIVLTFDKEDGGFAKSSLDKPMNKSAAEAAAAKYYGKDIRLKCVLEGELMEDNSSDTRKNAGKENELEENIIKLFGRDKVEVIDEE